MLIGSTSPTNGRRVKQGEPPIQIGGGSYFSDPLVDEQEESVEVVQAFFRDAEKFEEELKKVYAERRKDSKGSGGEDTNNW